MPRLFNHKSSKNFRRQLRNNPPFAEIVLWQYLRNRLFYGYKFRRQHGIGPYVVDFYCPKLKLVIEVDGDSHFGMLGRLPKDKKRQRWIEQWGLNIIRFTNDQIIEDTEGTLLLLKDFIGIENNTPPPTPPQ